VKLKQIEDVDNPALKPLIEDALDHHQRRKA
jgi:hypothetical protein